VFGFTIPYTDSASNLRHYYPDFVAVDTDGTHWLIETKGREDTEVQNKDRSALIWAENATTLTGQTWGYVKVLQASFEAMQPNEFSDLVHLGKMQLKLSTDM
jgi:type III restriction enzyme